MASGFEFKLLNDKAFQRATKIAPKRVFGAVRRKFKTGGRQFTRQAGQQLFSGQPGISLPTRLFSKNGKLAKGSAKDAKSERAKHIKAKAGGKRSTIFLAAYTSRFATFHQQKLRPLFESLFKALANKLRVSIPKEAARIAQAVLDKGLRDKGLR